MPRLTAGGMGGGRRGEGETETCRQRQRQRERDRETETERQRQTETEGERRCSVKLFSCASTDAYIINPRLLGLRAHSKIIILVLCYNEHIPNSMFLPSLRGTVGMLCNEWSNLVTSLFNSSENLWLILVQSRSKKHNKDPWLSRSVCLSVYLSVCLSVSLSLSLSLSACLCLSLPPPPSPHPPSSQSRHCFIL